MFFSLPEIRLLKDKEKKTLILFYPFVDEVSCLDNFKFERNGTYTRKSYIDYLGFRHKQVSVQRYKLSHIPSKQYIVVSALDKDIVQKIELFVIESHNSTL